MTTAHDLVDHVLIATLLVGLALVMLVDVGSTGAVLIGLVATPILCLLSLRHAARGI